jgi:hypothetical protein
MNNKKELSIEDIYNGMKVIDGDGITGVITECSDVHNILVDYGDDGRGLYCLDNFCDDYDPLFKVE